MSGSSDAVRVPPPPGAVAASGRSGSGSPLPSPRLGRPQATISKVAWFPRGDLGQGEWLATGRWIGDWIRYGSSRWGEKYVEAARVTGYDVASLRNMAWVASQFDPSLRSDKLTWSHHVLLAPLGADEQARWLDRAARERLSVADLRTELRALKSSQEDASSGADAADERAAALVCPHCGHELDRSAE
jgi:hypothetical protein